MPLAKFNEVGDLPQGVHLATLNELLQRFGSRSVQRKILAMRVERMHKIAMATGSLLHFVIFGSFITSKVDPNDVDLFMVMDNNFDVARLAGEARLLFDHAAAQSHFGCSVFWIRRIAAIGGEQAAIEDWQIKRDGTRRGVVEIMRDEE
jgi:hypothetical protein